MSFLCVVFGLFHGLAFLPVVLAMFGPDRLDVPPVDLGIISEAERRQKKKMLIDYLHGNLKNHNFWAYRYFFCELLSLLNLFGEILP